MTENISLAAALKKYFGFDTFKGIKRRLFGTYYPERIRLY